MKQLIDYIPLLIFFTVWSLEPRPVEAFGFTYQLGGIFSAAEFLLTSSIITYGVLYFLKRSLDKFQWITVGAVILFCIPTIIFRNVEFLKWKAPIVNWIFAAIFFSSTYFSKKPAIAHMMDHTINAPEEVWFKLNKLWIAYFVLLGGINLFVAFSLSEALWIKFKVFGNLTLTFLFVFGQMPLLSKYLPQE